MIVVPPLEVTDAIFTSSTVSEPHAPADYNAGTTYAVGAFVTDAATLVVYESQQSSNTGHTPASSPLWWEPVGYKEVAWNAGTGYTAAVTDKVYYQHRIYQSILAGTGKNPYSEPLYWEDIGPTLKWAMFDTLRNTATVGASPITTVITPGTRVDTLAVLGVDADTVRIQMTISGDEVYDETADLITRGAVSWYDYFFQKFRQQSVYLFQNIPPFTNGVITATFTRSTGNPRCGALATGSKVEIGTTQKNPNDDILNFSTIERDSFGNSTLIPRRTAPKATLVVWAAPSLLPGIRAARISLNARPAVFAGLTDNDSAFFPSLLILGYYRGWSIALTHLNQVIQTIELEEV